MLEFGHLGPAENLRQHVGRQYFARAAHTRRDRAVQALGVERRVGPALVIQQPPRFIPLFIGERYDRQLEFSLHAS